MIISNIHTSCHQKLPWRNSIFNLNIPLEKRVRNVNYLLHSDKYNLNNTLQCNIFGKEAIQPYGHLFILFCSSFKCKFLFGVHVPLCVAIRASHKRNRKLASIGFVGISTLGVPSYFVTYFHDLVISVKDC